MIDAATSTFLEAVAADLQRQLGIAGSVDDVSLEQLSGGHVAILATIRVAGQAIATRGTGENILAAYAALRQSVPQPVLESAFLQIIDS
jgi:hypothetical protein